MTRGEFLKRIGREYRRYFDKLFTQAGKKFRTLRDGNQGHYFSNEKKSRTLRTPDGEAIIIFRLDRSLSIDRLGIEVLLDSPERSEGFLQVYPAILDVLAEQEGLT